MYTKVRRRQKMVLYSALSHDFMMLDYARTHSQLLLRSQKNKERDYNIDILFKPVENILIPTSIHGLEISLENGERESVMQSAYGFKQDNSYRIFRITDSAGMIFFINAAIFCVFHNKQITPCESGLKDGMGGFEGVFGKEIMNYRGD